MLDVGGCNSANYGAFSVTVMLLDPGEVRVFNPVRDGANFSLSFLATSGRKYTLEFKSRVADPAWTPLYSKTSSGGVTTMTDFSPTGEQRCYRVRAE